MRSRLGFWPTLLALLALAIPSRAESPKVTGFTPESGPPGTLVKIIGENLDAVMGVFFQGIQSQQVEVVSSQHLKAVVPEGARTGPIGIIGRDGLRVYSTRAFVVPRPAAGAPPLALELPSPSPASRNVTIGFSLSVPGRARLSVLDLRARQIRVLVEDEFSAGPHVRAWDGRDSRGRRAPSGLYFIQLEAERKRLVRRTLLVG